MTPGQGWTLCATAAAVFVLACAGLNPLCLTLSPVALLWAGLYSWSKRFTWLTHFWLGSVLGLAPIGGWLAYDPVFTLPAVLFALGVTFWVAGFDILYACQDMEFDRQSGLNSIPACFGITAALGFSSLAHLMAALFFLLAGWSAGLGAVYFVFWAVISGVLIWEHTLVSADDLSRVDMAFFTLNGVIAVILCLGVVVDVL
jgi:4-hydroxybenzoate polyprenyltransferase